MLPVQMLPTIVAIGAREQRQDISYQRQVAARPNVLGAFIDIEYCRALTG